MKFFGNYISKYAILIDKKTPLLCYELQSTKLKLKDNHYHIIGQLSSSTVKNRQDFWGPKNFASNNDLRLKKVLVPKHFGSQKKFGLQKILDEKKISVQKNLMSKKISFR